MSKSHLRQQFSALALLTDIEYVSPLTLADLLAGASDQRSTGPGLALLEKRSDRRFVVELAERVAGLGLDEELANALVAQVLTSPSLAVVRNARTGGSTERRTLQAVCVEDDEGTYLVHAFVTIKDGKPPEVISWEVGVELVDLDPANRDELAEILKRTERWRLDYGVREVHPVHGAAGPIVWFGDPSRVGYIDVPPDWEATIKGIGLTLGAKVYVTTSSQALRALALDQRAELLLVTVGATLDSDLQSRFSDKAVKSVDVGSPGTSFDALADEARHTLLVHYMSATTIQRTVSRTLKPGEVVYHRKIGTSGGGYDNFDEGSLKPCMHGADQFRPFRAADKAAKGMARRYTNFEPSWLYHCSRYPNCGVYAVQVSGNTRQ